MASNYRIERSTRPRKFPATDCAAQRQVAAAFPVEQEGVRPLATGAAREIAAVMDWPLP